MPRPARRLSDQSGKVTAGAYGPSFAKGTWTSTYEGHCASRRPRRGGDRR